MWSLDLNVYLPFLNLLRLYECSWYINLVLVSDADRLEAAGFVENQLVNAVPKRPNNNSERGCRISLHLVLTRTSQRAARQQERPVVGRPCTQTHAQAPVLPLLLSSLPLFLSYYVSPALHLQSTAHADSPIPRSNSTMRDNALCAT